MERRVLIIESHSEFALSMASVLKTAGYQTAMAQTSAEAQRELEKRRPDLVILRAELPDQSGFVLCGQIKKGKFGQNLPVVLLSSDVGHDGLSQHSQTPNAADAYLSIPFEMGELASVTTQMVPPPPLGAEDKTQSGTGPEPERDDMDDSLDNALSGNPQPELREPSPGPPPIRTAPAGGPPKLPKRERRSAITEEDRTFLDRTFQSIADRKAELLAESKQVKRSPPRRDMMGTPEGKIQILRDELKIREAQVARISEIWGVRERELLSVEDRVHEKDVELQGLKMQVDDLLRRFNDAQQAAVQKERDHGATVDDLLLQKFATEKDLIEVVASKEKDINVLKREASAREEELARRGQDLDTTRREFEQLERQNGAATMEFELHEQKLKETVAQRDSEIDRLQDEWGKTQAELSGTVSERDSRYSEYNGEIEAIQEALQTARDERESSVKDLESRLRSAIEHGVQSDDEIKRLNVERAELENRLSGEVSDLERQLHETVQARDDLKTERDELTQEMADRLSERDGRIGALERELVNAVEQREKNEAELNTQLESKVERIGELEGEVEAVKAHLSDREEELGAEITAITEARAQLEADLTTRLKTSNDRIAALDSELEGLKHDITARDEAIAMLRSDVRAHEASIEALQKDVATRDGRIQNLEVELTDTRNQITQLKDEVSGLETNVLEREEKIDGLEAELSTRARRISTLTEQLDDANTAVSHLNREVAELTQTLSARDERIGKQVETLAARDTEVAELSGSLEATAQELGKSQDTFARTAQLLSETQGELQATSQELESTRSTLDQTQSQLTQTQGELNVTLGRRDELDEELKTAQGVLAKTQEDLAHMAKERSDRESELKTARSEIQRYTLLLRQSEEARAELEATSNGEIGDLRSQLSETQGTLEAEQAAHAKLGDETTAAIAALQQEATGLAKSLETTRADLQDTQVARDNTRTQLDREKSEHAKSRQQAAEHIKGLEDSLLQSQEQGEDLEESLRTLKQELGARVAEVTQLSALVTQAENRSHQVEERLETLTEENQTQLELLQHDIAQKSQELQDAQRKLATGLQEAKRQSEALTREVAAKGEQLRQADGKVRILTEDGKKKQDELSQKLLSVTRDFESMKTELSDQLAQHSKGQAQAVAERDRVKETLGAQLQDVTAKAQQLNTMLQNERKDYTRTTDEVNQKLQRAEGRVAQLTQDLSTKLGDLETRSKEAQLQLQQRTKKIQELELAFENATSAKTRAEKDAAARIAAAESRANEASAKMGGLAKERKDLEGKQLNELNELIAKQKTELERRDAIKAQEVARLQQTVQEKSKQLKVVELELARYKTKGTAAAGAPKAGGVARPPVAASMDDEETKVHSLAGEVRTSPGSVTGVARPTASRPAVASAAQALKSAATQAPPQSKTGQRPAIASDAGPEKTMVVLPGGTDDDWTALVDELDK